MSDKRYQEEYLRRIHKVQDYIEQHTGIMIGHLKTRINIQRIYLALQKKTYLISL